MSDLPFPLALVLVCLAAAFMAWCCNVQISLNVLWENPSASIDDLFRLRRKVDELEKQVSLLARQREMKRL